VGIVAAGCAAWLFPRAVPILTLDQQLTRGTALERADSFFSAHALAPSDARTAVRFQAHDSLLTYVDFAGGGRDSLAALAQGDDVAPFTWSVRAFVPRDPREARVDFAPDGRVVGFRRVLAEADERPDLGAEGGRALAERVLTEWIGEDGAAWRLAASSYETRAVSQRIDRTYTFEHVDRRVAEAPIRLDIVVAGDTPSAAQRYVVVPESFRRRYAEMRSANDLLTLLASVGLLALMVLAVVTLRRYGVAHEVRWRPAFIAGSVVGALFIAAGLNQLPGSWFVYDTATSPGTFRAMVTGSALLTGVAMTLLVGLTLAAAEVATRHAFPEHLDWWKLWRYRGTRNVAGQVAGGYVVAALGLAYVALFYLITRNLFGWWVPTELLDDPNLIASPLPWVSGVAIALQAGVWEESLTRALPLALLAIWVRDRPRRTLWMAGGVIATSLVFAFAHASYPSWPPYSRGVEIFLDACFWAVLFLWFGLLVTVLAHFAYNLVLFGAFAAAGSAAPYRITLGIVVLVLLAPALAVAWKWLQQRRLAPLPADARFAAWRASERAPPAPFAQARTHSLTGAGRRVALALGGGAVLLMAFLPVPETLGRPFTATRDAALATADSVLQARGVDPSSWRRLAAPATDSQGGLHRFLRSEQAESLAVVLADEYAPPAWWGGRYVRTDGTASERAEEWRVRLWPDGTPLDHRHIIPDSAPRTRPGPDEARLLAGAAIAQAGFDLAALRETDYEVTERPARADVRITYTDTTLRLPGEAAAQVWVTLAGDEPLSVRRGVELPETFIRAERDRATTLIVIVLLCAAVFLGLVITGVILVVRQSAPVLDDGHMSRRTTVLVVVGLTIFGVAQGLNSLPGLLSNYQTSVPWSTFLGTLTITQLLVVIPALALLGFWLVLSALRRRVGVPLFPAGEEGATSDGRRDLLLAGLGLGAVLTLTELVVQHMGSTGIPEAPSTLLNHTVPAIGEALWTPLGALSMVMLLGIPGLVIAGISERRTVRIAAAALLAAPLLGLVLAAAPTGTNLVALASLVIVAAVLAVGVALRFWAAFCVWAWVVAALVYEGMGGIHLTFHAPTGVERVAGVVSVVLVIALIALALRVVPRPSGLAPTD
jgi:hypothetical protein